MIAQDPTCSASILYRKPMTFELFGIAGSFSSTTVPDRFHGYAEKQNVPENRTVEEYYQALCDQVAHATSPRQAAAEYADLANRVRHARRGVAPSGGTQ